MEVMVRLMDYYYLVVVSALFQDLDIRQLYFGHSSDDHIKSLGLSV
jgi:hypothetical protein